MIYTTYICMIYIQKTYPYFKNNFYVNSVHINYIKHIDINLFENPINYIL